MLSEVRIYFDQIADHHKQVIEIIDGLPSDGLNWEPVEVPQLQVSNSAAALAAHIAGSEHFWIGETVGGLPATRDRDAEFATRIRRPTVLIQHLNTVLEETRQILEKLTETDLTRTITVRDRESTVRYALLHVVEHTALHLGHMQLTVQLWTKGDSKSSPTWFSRFPPR